MFDTIFILIFGFTIVIFIFVISMVVSPKLRGKFMSNQIKATKYMIDESKKDLEDILSTSSDAVVNSSKNIIDKHEDTLKDISKRAANIAKDGIEITTKAIKDGLTNSNIYCKYCGSSIDKDSKYCKNCGKKQ